MKGNTVNKIISANQTTAQNLFGLTSTVQRLSMIKQFIIIIVASTTRGIALHTLSSDNHRSGPGRAPVADQVLCTRRRRGHRQCAVRSYGKWQAYRRGNYCK